MANGLSLDAPSTEAASAVGQSSIGKEYLSPFLMQFCLGFQPEGQRKRCGISYNTIYLFLARRGLV